MTIVETRQVDRDSLLLMADVRAMGGESTHRVKVRNLSAGGMMAEGPVRATLGAQVIVTLRNLGDVEGSIAWIHENRFGISFLQEIDPKQARAPVGSMADVGSTGFRRPAAPPPVDPVRLRNI